jgi:hypothetical protein
MLRQPHIGQIRARTADCAALVTTALLTATPAVGQDNLSVTVKVVTAQVNRTGGITVSETMNCAAAVQAAGGVSADPNVRSWGIADPTADFLPWMSSYYNSLSTPTYVFPMTGRFGKGVVHIEVTVFGEPGTNGPDPNVYPVDPATGNINGVAVASVQVFGVTGFDVRAR